MLNRVDPTRRLTVVGIGADGLAGLPAASRALIEDADVLLGAPRQLALVPEAADQRRLTWPSPLKAGLPGLLAKLPQGDVVAVASGDPLVSGIGATLVELLGADAVRIVPAVSSVALARAELGWSAADTAVVSLVGRPIGLLARELAPGRRVLALSADETTPAAVAALLVGAGYGASRLHVLGDLGSAAASRIDGIADAWSARSPRLNVVGIEVVGPHRLGWTPGLPDTAYAHDGQLTKRDLRASALARLAPTPGGLLWDVGAGAGSVGIEWLRAHPTCRAIAIESNPERATRIMRNATTLGVPGLRVVRGAAPEALAGLPEPDAIFVGGGASVPGVLDTCLAALRPGGRLVVHGVTLETEMRLAGLFAERGGELTRIGIEVAAPLGSFTGWTPARCVTQWAWTKPA
ncbi:precorrin-6y C5,15-methyltransferase (decarboxylating) subunit CbiE [Propioniciclava coleopterorum]|uniref:Precorrin-6y C5,15-methyltransferase (Decarboxylating) subunit CbiE n=1 Tax=Propioniciclava coleopterorum TaxID=2714937 RepID=A0A6G7Y6I4_9ACTN|nr:precorrin-6y C5,15-methyltransferase (decarboxylating) subunit CbiE [Propioniciclava coleopterorum]QIK72393.1 precorrin-6y C5,15-methyltransferase (decarboxylating) subunit CbiE [Propioniciclava coleopterorum]